MAKLLKQGASSGWDTALGILDGVCLDRVYNGSTMTETFTKQKRMWQVS